MRTYTLRELLKLSYRAMPNEYKKHFEKAYVIGLRDLGFYGLLESIKIELPCEVVELRKNCYYLKH